MTRPPAPAAGSHGGREEEAGPRLRTGTPHRSYPEKPGEHEPEWYGGPHPHGQHTSGGAGDGPDGGCARAGGGGRAPRPTPPPWYGTTQESVPPPAGGDTETTSTDGGLWGPMGTLGDLWAPLGT